MFFQKRGKMALALAASGLCLFSFGALAQDSSPYVGDSERARVNEAMLEEQALIKDKAAASSSKSLTINPFPVTSSAPSPETVEKPVAEVTPPQAETPVPASVVQVESAPSAPPVAVHEGFEVIDLTVAEQPEEVFMLEPESPAQMSANIEQEAQSDNAPAPQDTFDVSVKETPAQEPVQPAPQHHAENAAEPIDPDLLVIPPALYEKRMSPDQLPRPVKIKRENNKTVEVQSGRVMPGMAPIEQSAAPAAAVSAASSAPPTSATPPAPAVPVQEPAKEVAVLPGAPGSGASYEPPPEVADSGWQPDSAPQSIMVREEEVEPVYAQPPATMKAEEKVNWIEPPPVKRWRALRGTSLHEQLAVWAREGGMRFIWDTDRSFIVKETFSVQSSYEQALSALLSQYEGDNFRPYGKAYLDPASGKRVVVIRSVD